MAQYKEMTNADRQALALSCLEFYKQLCTGNTDTVEVTPSSEVIDNNDKGSLDSGTT